VTGPTITRGELALVPVAPEHLETLRVWRNSSAVGQFMYSETNLSPEDQLRWFSALEADPRRASWVIIAAGEPVGALNLIDYDASHRRASAGYYLGEESMRGVGLGALVEFLLLELFFGHFDGHRLERQVFASNEAAVRMLEQFGFRREGLLREYAVKNGHRIDVVALAMLAPEWRAIRGHFDALLPS
jgi:UDP-4-amino-4,6-dideoxy-N-acetyl-beta-L-altrosamine N-acetyltransferase